MGDGIATAMREAATACDFAIPPFIRIWGFENEVFRVFLNSVCGWNLGIEEVKDIALRNYYFNRCISLREGYHPAKDDHLPPRAFEEPITDKYGKTWVWDKAHFEQEKRRYYVETLNLTPEGLPPKKGLERLGLDFVVPKLEQMGTLG